MIQRTDEHHESHHHAHQGTAGVRDPVCGMTVDPATAKGGHSTHDGKTYSFCSTRCREKFDADPASYLAPAAPPASTSPHDAVDYTCPMHPEILQRGPGSCPICGMALEPVLPTLTDEADGELRAMTRRLWLSALFTAPVFLVAMLDMIPGQPVSRLLGDKALWLELVLTTPVVFWGGWPFFTRAATSLRTMRLNMFTLIAIGTSAAFGYSLVALLFPHVLPTHGHGSVYFESAAVIVTLVLVGQVLELRARASTSGAIRALLRLQPKTATRVDAAGTERVVPIDDIVIGDRVRIIPGEQVPVDGIVSDGASAVDESMVSGEPTPVEKRPHDEVKAGTLNGTGALVVCATQVGAGTLLARIVRMVSEAQRSRAPIQRLADAVSAWFVPMVLVTALLTFLGWWLWGPSLSSAVANAVAVLIIACPCALGLATPMSIMVGTGRGAHAGVLIRNAEALETLSRIDTLLVDKTGTLTEGRPTLVTVETRGIEETRLLALAAGLERDSEHPLAAAIVRGATSRGVPPMKSERFQSFTGLGVVGSTDGHELAIGTRDHLTARGVTINDADGARAATLEKDGQTVMWVAVDGVVAGLLGVTDPIKASTKSALQALSGEGIRVVMLTGDRKGTAEHVAAQLGIGEVIAEVRPDHKAEVVRRLREEGRFVAMAGDGINDAPALASAHVGIAMGTGTDVAIEAASVTLVKGDLLGIVRARRLSRAVVRNIRQNLLFAFAYNVLGIPLAAGLLYPFTGWLLSPMIASAAMSLSSVSVIANALRLRKVALDRT